MTSAREQVALIRELVSNMDEGTALAVMYFYARQPGGRRTIWDAPNLFAARLVLGEPDKLQDCIEYDEATNGA